MLKCYFMSGISHFEDGETTYYSSKNSGLNATIIQSFDYLDDPLDRMQAQQLLAENEVTASGRRPAEFLFTDDYCDLILKSIGRRYSEPFLSCEEGLVWAIRAGRIEIAIREARGEVQINAGNN